MSVEIGTATNYIDLMVKLKTFLTTDTTLVGLGQNWVCLHDNGIEQYYKAPGLSTTEEIYTAVRTYEDVPNDLYNVEVVAYLGYIPGNSWEAQPGWASAKDSFFPLWNNSIPYWFIANGQRVIVIAKVNTTYQSMYMGKFLPYATPNQYTYPVFWGGMTGLRSHKYSESSSTGFQFFPRSISNSAHLYTPDGSIISSANNAVVPAEASFVIYPFSDTYNTTTSHLSKLAPFDNGDVVLIPASICRGVQTPSQNVQANYGELDGVFYISGFGQSSESIITIDTVNYMVVQNGSRVAVNDFMAVRLA